MKKCTEKEVWIKPTVLKPHSNGLNLFIFFNLKETKNDNKYKTNEINNLKNNNINITTKRYYQF
jgi:hypothetical protein